MEVKTELARADEEPSHDGEHDEVEDQRTAEDGCGGRGGVDHDLFLSIDLDRDTGDVVEIGAAHP